MRKTDEIVTHGEIGEVRYIRNPQAKNLSIRINRQGEVRVTIPRFVSRRRAETFLDLKKDWVREKLFQIRRQQRLSRKPEAGEMLQVRGRIIPIILKRHHKNVEDAIWEILLIESKEYLPERVRELAARYGFRYRQVKIRKMKSRWGSCSGNNNINLNSWLVMLPDHLSDYVILHELVHTRHRDHSTRFWKALDTVTGGSAKQLRKELREQKIMYFHSGINAD